MFQNYELYAREAARERKQTLDNIAATAVMTENAQRIVDIEIANGKAAQGRKTHNPAANMRRQTEPLNSAMSSLE